MNRNTLYLSLLLTAGIAAGCGSSQSGYVPKKTEAPPVAQINPGEERKLMPLAVGNQWTYAIEVTEQAAGGQGQTRNAEITWRVARVNTNGNATVGEIEVVQDGAVRDLQVWRVTDKGVYQVSVGNNPRRAFSTPQPVVQFPIKDGAKFTWTGTGPTVAGSTGQSRVDNVIRGIQTVDTEVGPMSAVAVESNSRFTVAIPAAQGRPARSAQGTMQSTTWFSPEVGLVRAQQTTTVAGAAGQRIVLRLKSRSLK